MDLKTLLNQALNSDLVRQGKEQLKQHANKTSHSSPSKMSREKDAREKHSNETYSKNNSKTYPKNNPLGSGVLGASALGGTLGGGLIGLLMGSKKSKSMGKTALKAGGVAALGALAYKVYNDWQQSQSSMPKTSTEPCDFNEHDLIHSELIFKAMIAAAKADGHVDHQEMLHIEQMIQKAGADSALQQMLHRELNQPLDPAQIAQLATTPQQASEIYLASLLVIDEQNFMEKAYLQELANQLRLPPHVIEQLTKQAH